MELPATHGTAILRAATRKMTSIMNINEQNFLAAREQLPRYSNISGYATELLYVAIATVDWG